MKIVLLIASLFIAAPVRAQGLKMPTAEQLFGWTTPVYFVTIGADMHLTYTCLSAELCIEQGPAARGWVSRRGPLKGMAIRGAVGVGLWAGFKVAQKKLPQKYKVGPAISLLTMTAVNGWVWHHNEQELKKVGLR